MKKIRLIFALIAVSSTHQMIAAQVPSPDIETVAEKSNYLQTPRYPETVAFSRILDSASGEIVFKTFGKSSEGRDLPLLIAARDGDFSPLAARRSGKAVVLVQAAIHAGEPDGKDAGLALFRDIALKRGAEGLLEDTVILFIPIFNVDGHELFGKYNRINQNGPSESGFRANSANLNLNRDYLKADTPETRAWLKLWNAWNPDFFIDCHVTDGADFRYNVTYEFAHHGEVHSILSSWMKNHFEGNVVPLIEKKGNLISRYIQMIDRSDPGKGIVTFIAGPRFATGYTPLRNRIGLLIEAHSVKPYKFRVRGTYDTIVAMIAEISREKQSLFKANQIADGTCRGCETSPPELMVLSQKVSRESNPILFKGYDFKLEDSQVSGATKIVYGRAPIDRTIPQYDSAEPAVTVKVPAYYVIPPQWLDVIDRLAAHGLRFWRIQEPVLLKVESYRFENPKWSNSPFEGRITLSAKSLPVSEARIFPANSIVIPLDQTGWKIAVHFLEPDAPDSALFWGFFNSIFEQKEYAESYVMDKIAEQMLRDDPGLRSEFEERLKDADFSANPRARLRFFYERSPYQENRIGIYPVGRVFEAGESAKLLIARPL